jgi:hypothetical protein
VSAAIEARIVAFAQRHGVMLSWPELAAMGPVEFVQLCTDAQADREALRSEMVGDWQPPAVDFREPSAFESNAGEPRGRAGR